MKVTTQRDNNIRMFPVWLEYKTIKPNVLAVQSTIDYNSCLFILPKGFSEKLVSLNGHLLSTVLLTFDLNTCVHCTVCTTNYTPGVICIRTEW